MGQSDEPADTFLFLGLLGEFVNRFGGEGPKYIFWGTSEIFWK